MKKLFLFLMILTVSLSCKKKSVSPLVECSETVNRDIGTFFSILNSTPSYELVDSGEFETHQYTFTVEDKIQICSFGYKSQGTGLNYNIQITDNAGNVIFEQGMNFDDANFDYIDVPPFILNPGQYSISRTVLNNSNALEAIGPVTMEANGSVPFFPVNLGVIVVTSSEFYNASGSIHNYAIPNIYFDYIKL